MIRINNIDFETEGMKRHQSIFVGNLTASISIPIFVAPIACIVNRIDFVQKTNQVHNDSQTMTMTIRQGAAVTSTLGTFISAVSANTRFSITPSAHNSLTQGTILELDYSQTCQTMDRVTIDVTYTPLKHRSNN